ncbi:MAG: nuclear transport factor 2 family protein [Brevundimonas sp.]|uniref:nuclear transport factor 2 family protein n=1 Tax=Brevundimonas sp. TaxID=1871086 RepID=UPI002487C91E|nr:nuclear transport factor 2 family protein [Brevundimonas sp.]MDI1328401.1 nuclear transport factor 2 family protein [Brevundimonas sp.]
MAAGRNRATLEAVFEGLAVGDGRAFVDAMAEDFTWIMIGSTDWSGVYRGKAAVRGELLRPLMARFKSYRNTPRRFIVDGDRAAIQCQGDAETLDGKRYDNTYCWVVRFRNGQLVELTEYMDTQLVVDALGPYERGAA